MTALKWKSVLLTMIGFFMFSMVSYAQEGPCGEITRDFTDDVYAVGDTIHFPWTTIYEDMTTALVSFSLDGGITFITIIEDEALNSTDSDWENFSWIIPDTLKDLTESWFSQSTVTDNARMMLSDYNFPTCEDVLTENFKIIPGPPEAVHSAGKRLAAQRGITAKTTSSGTLRFEGSTIEIFSLNGNRVFTCHSSSDTPLTAVHNLASGLYTIRHGNRDRNIDESLSLSIVDNWE